MPKLSIITVNLNNLEGLQKTMQSVFEQTFTDYEYIIIDGGSTDGSKEYVEQYVGKLAYWVSEKDGGVYEAMNKGIKKAAGEYCNFLNSGDYLLTSKTLATVFDQIKSCNGDIFYGNIQIFENNEKIYFSQPSKVSLAFWRDYNINHQSAFYRRSLFCELGLYDLRFKWAADHAFHLKASLAGKCFCHLSTNIVYYDIVNSFTSLTDYKLEKDIVYGLYVPTEIQTMISENIYFHSLVKRSIIKFGIKLDKRYKRIKSYLQSFLNFYKQ